MQSIRSAATASFAVAVLLGLTPPVAAAGSGTAEEELWSGQIVSTHSRWARGKTTIVTDSVLRTPSGEEVTLQQLGGSVDGIGMVVLHSTPILRVGDQVVARVAVARDLAGRVSRPVRALSGFSPTGGPVPFVRAEATETRAPLAWESGCALIQFDAAGTSHIEGDLEFDEMARVLATWNDAVEGCSYFQLRSAGRTTGEVEVGLDGTNLVKFREDRWCRPATDEEPEVCYDHAAAALTTLFFVDDANSDRNGAMLDADVEINAVDFNVAVGHISVQQDDDCESDLANTFTHELGHLMGLDHTCWIGAGVHLTNNRGEPLPRCSSALPPEVTEATMFNFEDCGETKKATPEADDIEGICTIYPLADDPHECRPAEIDSGGGCCTVAGGTHADRGSGAAALVILGAFALIVARRRSPHG